MASLGESSTLAHALSFDQAQVQALSGSNSIVQGNWGSVALVGAGPGSPGLLTLDAVLALQRCDSILYDKLIPQAVLDLARPDAAFVYTGKGPELNMTGAKEVQDFIENELVRRAKLGENVVRL